MVTYMFDKVSPVHVGAVAHTWRSTGHSLPLDCREARAVRCSEPYLLPVASLQVGVDRLVSASLDGLGQHLETLTSARAGGSHQEDAVTNGQQLRQLYHPQDEVVFWGETHFQGGVHNNL